MPPKAARPNKHLFLENLWFLGAPGLKKTTWPKIRFGIPLVLLRFEYGFNRF